MPQQTLLEIREMARSTSKIPVASRIGKLRKESEEVRRDRELAKAVREKTRVYKHKIMKL
jgi:hypothetical protein